LVIDLVAHKQILISLQTDPEYRVRVNRVRTHRIADEAADQEEPLRAIGVDRIGADGVSADSGVDNRIDSAPKLL